MEGGVGDADVLQGKLLEVGELERAAGGVLGSMTVA
jgi:hypothetical protein